MDLLNQIPIGILAVLPVLPVVAYFIYVQIWVSKVSQESQQKKISLSAAQTAQRILKNAGVEEIPVEKWDDFSSSTYDKSQKKIFLSPKIYEEKDVFSVGTAIEKAGLAIFDAHKPQILSLWKFTTVLYMLLYWTVAFVLPYGAITSSVPAIVFSYILIAAILVLYCFNAAVKKMLQSNVLKQLREVENIDETEHKNVQRALKAISLAW